MAGPQSVNFAFQEPAMGTIIIKDLPDNVDLDRQAMRDIVGGARYRTQGATAARPSPRGSRIVDFGAGTVRTAGTDGKPAAKQTP
jgi:hypothetical protein